MLLISFLSSIGNTFDMYHLWHWPIVHHRTPSFSRFSAQDHYLAAAASCLSFTRSCWFLPGAAVSSSLSSRPCRWLVTLLCWSLPSLSLPLVSSWTAPAVQPTQISSGFVLWQWHWVSMAAAGQGKGTLRTNIHGPRLILIQYYLEQLSLRCSERNHPRTQCFLNHSL